MISEKNIFIDTFFFLGQAAMLISRRALLFAAAATILSSCAAFSPLVVSKTISRAGPVQLRMQQASQEQVCF
jgi:arginine exporter protein ArgO